MSRLRPFVFALVCLAPLTHAGSLPPITFDPPAPSANGLVTANLPFEICAWTVADSPGHLDINYQLAPCAIGLFTSHIPLGRLAAGSYAVAANQVMPNAGTQASGPLVVGGGQVATTPAAGPLALALLALGMGVAAYRRRQAH